MMDLMVEFLRARYEDEAQLARESEGAWIPLGPAPEDTRPIARLMRLADPVRVLRQVETWRRIVDACVETLAGEDAWDPQLEGGSGEEFLLARYTLKLLAAPYDSHPDYRPEWRP